MIRFVFRPKRKVRGKNKTARLYSGRYRIEGDVRMTEVPLKTTDKQVAEKFLDELVREKEKERAGILPPKKLRDSAVQQMGKHLTDFLNNLRAIGRDEDYVKNLRYRIDILLRECGWVYPANVSPDSFEAWRAERAEASSTTKNQYLDSVNAMLNWMVANGRIVHNPLSVVEKVEFEPVRVRRAFRDEEIRRLLNVAGESRIGYLLAVHTGLRRGELKALLWRHVKNLYGNNPTLLLDGRFTKNREDADIPLHPEIVKELRALKPADAKPSDFVLIGRMLPSIWMMKVHLKKAGIEYEKNGRRADFHSLRHTLATNLASRNVPPRVAMKILRHSDIRLTMNHYTDETCLPVAEAIQSLPSFGGTEAGNANTQIHPQTPDVLRTEQSRSGTIPVSADSLKVVRTEELWRSLSLRDIEEHGLGKSCLARTRT